MNKPARSQRLLVVGLVLQGIGGAIYANAFANSLKASIYSDSSGTTSGMGIGALVALVGWIVLLVGISRASAGIDYLVALATPPTSAVQRRAEESRLAASQATQTPPSA